MNRPKQYFKAIDTLIKAYHNKKLVHGNCVACAVGNLVATACNYEDDGWNAHWYTSIRSYLIGEFELGDEQIRATGYSKDEIFMIERAFEGQRFVIEMSMDALDGLTAVINELGRIHDVPEHITRDICDSIMICTPHTSTLKGFKK